MLSGTPLTFRALRREPAHVFVSILGLAIGLGFCLLTLAYARYSWSYDAHIPDADQVYVVKHRRNWELGKPWLDQAPMSMRDRAARSVPGVANITGYTNWFPITIELPEGLREVRSLSVLPGFAKMLGLRALQGDLEATLARPDAVALTEAGARRLFGSANVLGQTVTLRLNAADTTVATVAVGAILPTPPANTTIPYEMLHGFDLALLPPWAKDEALTGQRGYQGGYLLAKLAPGASADEVTRNLQALADDSPLVAKVPDFIKAHTGGDKFVEVKLAPLRDAYLDEQIFLNVFSKDVPRGNPRVVASVTAVGMLLLLLAAFNYVNLTAIRVLRRQREITLRKVLGTSRRRLIWHIAGESLASSLLATLIGIGLAILALPAFGELVNRDLQGVLTLGNLAAALGLGAFLGLLTAIYPAWMVLRIRPAHMLAGRGDDESRRDRRLRRVLAVAQLALAMGLCSVTLAVTLQTRHAVNLPLGFDPSSLLVAPLPEGMSAKFTDQARGLREALSQHPDIAGVAVINDALGRNREVWASDFRREGGDIVFLDIKAVSGNFFELHGIAPLAGKLFSSADTDDVATSPLVLNAEAARALGYSSPGLAVGTRMQLRGFDGQMKDHEVIGIAPPVRLQSLREPPRAVVYVLTSIGAVLVVKARGSRVDAERAMRDQWPKHLANDIPKITPSEDVFAESYDDDARLARLLALSTLVALLIAAGGAYVLATDAVLRRAREIALRKLFGARRGHIGSLVARELGKQLLLAAAVALPLASLAIARYLAPFSDTAPLPYAGFVLALLVATGVVAIAAAREAWRAMSMRPAAALRR